ncbi:hypothetical protein [Polaromonas sp.]|uniref:hypothetical protein n=1 Tax=Polaromonas sp. TaxID=1869339 RepID=UPI00352A04E2
MTRLPGFLNGSLWLSQAQRFFGPNRSDDSQRGAHAGGNISVAKALGNRPFLIVHHDRHRLSKRRPAATALYRHHLRRVRISIMNFRLFTTLPGLQ